MSIEPGPIRRARVAAEAIKLTRARELEASVQYWADLVVAEAERITKEGRAMSNRAINALGFLLGLLAVGVPTGVYLARKLRVPAGQSAKGGVR